MLRNDVKASDRREPVRWLGAARLSRDTDESTSIERQRSAIDLTVQVRGDVLVTITEDVDVSGSVSPFDREALGPWFDRPDAWDGIIVHKLDRLTRSLLDFANLIKWLEANGKTLVSVSESIDLATPGGRLMAKIIVLFAEFERERIGERVREMHQTVKHKGQFAGGKPPYGYLVGDGKRLVPDPVAAPVVRRIVADLIAGKPLAVVCRALTAEGVPTPKGAPVWRPQTLRIVVTSPALIGEQSYQGRPVRDADGAVITVTDAPLLTLHEWMQLQAALDTLARPHMVSHSRDHLLLQVAFCGVCGSPLWHRQVSGRAATYRCAQRCTGSLPAGFLEGLIERDLIDRFGSYRILRRAVSSGSPLATVSALARDIAELEADRFDHGLFSGEHGVARYRARMARLEAEFAEASARAAAADAAERWEPTGETVADRWNAASPEDRHQVLLRLGIRWHVQRIYRISDHARRWQIITDYHQEAVAVERLARPEALAA